MMESQVGVKAGKIGSSNWRDVPVDRYGNQAQVVIPNRPPPMTQQQQSTQQSLEAQVQNEAKLRSQRTLFSPSGGLLDTVNSAGKVLL